jgi:predicted HTH domain antitoxin
MNIMNIAIELPDSYAILQDLNSIQKELLLFYALMLFKQGRVSLSKAANISNLDIYDFMKECKKNLIPVIEVSKEELLQELEGF